MEYIYVIVLTLLINIPFGYLRGDHKPLSLLWFLYIHLPVPAVILFRKWFDVEISLQFAPFYFGSYLFGQWIGKKLYARRKSVA